MTTASKRLPVAASFSSARFDRREALAIIAALSATVGTAGTVFARGSRLQKAANAAAVPTAANTAAVPTASSTPPTVASILDKRLLLPMIADLVREQAKRDQFSANPEAFMNDYGLDANSRACVYTLNRQTIGDFINAEVGQWLPAFQSWQFPPMPYENEDCKPDDGSTGTAYPDPTLKAFRFRPKTVSIGGSGGKFDLLVYGESFDPKMKADGLMVKNASNAMLAVEYLTVEGTFRCSSIHARMTLPAGTAEGPYEVTVKNRAFNGMSNTATVGYPLVISA